MLLRSELLCNDPSHTTPIAPFQGTGYSNPSSNDQPKSICYNLSHSAPTGVADAEERFPLKCLCRNLNYERLRRCAARDTPIGALKGGEVRRDAGPSIPAMQPRGYRAPSCRSELVTGQVVRNPSV